MSEQQTELMQDLGITVAQQNIYSYKGHKYQNPADAIRYAQIDSARPVTEKDPEDPNA